MGVPSAGVRRDGCWTHPPLSVEEWADNNNSVMWSICSCVLYSAGSGVKIVHVGLSGLRMRLFACVHVCISFRCDWTFVFSMFMLLCVDGLLLVPVVLGVSDVYMLKCG